MFFVVCFFGSISKIDFPWTGSKGVGKEKDKQQDSGHEHDAEYVTKLNMRQLLK